MPVDGHHKWCHSPFSCVLQKGPHHQNMWKVVCQMLLEHVMWFLTRQEGDREHQNGSLYSYTVRQGDNESRYPTRPNQWVVMFLGIRIPTYSPSTQRPHHRIRASVHRSPTEAYMNQNWAPPWWKQCVVYLSLPFNPQKSANTSSFSCIWQVCADIYSSYWWKDVVIILERTA